MLKGFFKMQLWCLLIFTQHLFSQDLATTIASNSPAKHFTEAMPIGNGRLGAMVFGNTGKERIALNEISLWSGGPHDSDKDSAYIHLKPIQNLLLAGKNEEAQNLLMKHFVAKGDGTGLGRGANTKYGSYQTAGNLWIDWKDDESEIKDYENSLDVSKAVATTKYVKNGSLIEQQVFSDYKNDVIWIKISSQNKLPEFEVSLERKENVTSHLAVNNNLILYGQLPSGKDKGMKYLVSCQLMEHDGKSQIQNNSITITQAKNIVFAINILTNYNHENGNLNLDLNLEQLAKEKFDALKNLSFEKALAESTKIYQSYFNRTTLALNENKTSYKYTSQRLKDFERNSSDSKLLELYFNYGKYLLISSSRPGLLPANLQGLWAEEYQAPWNADYHLNINLQMNYWPAEVLNLSDLAEPLFRFTKNLVPNGWKTAQNYYNAKGWVAHVVSNPWFYTSPGESAEWGSTLTGGAWIATHLWEHYRFTQDKEFLKNYYPVLKSAAMFLKNILIEENSHHWLVTAPSNSPENTYIKPNGFQGNTCMGPTMDMQIARNLFTAVSTSSKILKTELNFGSELASISKRLAPNQISKRDGGIQEWLEDWPSAEPQHRHVSHLFALYPYDEISPEQPELFNAAKQTLLLRGDGGTGWSKAWKINFWARLQDGDHAFKMLKNLLSPVNFGTKSGGGTYPNLFDAHPPFQIDGNFGAVAGIAEMLLQSHGKKETIKLLPAIPRNENFRSGKFTGFKARNNFEVSCIWKDFEVIEAEIISKSGKNLRISVPKNKNLYFENGRNVENSNKKTDRKIEIKTKVNQKFIIK